LCFYDTFTITTVATPKCVPCFFKKTTAFSALHKYDSLLTDSVEDGLVIFFFLLSVLLELFIYSMSWMRLFGATLLALWANAAASTLSSFSQLCALATSSISLYVLLAWSCSRISSSVFYSVFSVLALNGQGCILMLFSNKAGSADLW